MPKDLYWRCTRLFLQACEEFLSRRIIPEEEDRRFGERPLEMGIADFSAGGAGTFPRRFLGALDQTAIGGKLLHPRETVDLMDFVAQHEAEALADARHRWQQIQGMGVMGLGRFDDGEFDVA